MYFMIYTILFSYPRSLVALYGDDDTQPNSAFIDLPFEKIRSKKYDKRRYVHFYMHDKYFTRILTSTEKYIDDLKQFDGVITPDFTMLIGQSKCLLETNTYFNRAVGFNLQKQGILALYSQRQRRTAALSHNHFQKRNTSDSAGFCKQPLF